MPGAPGDHDSPIAESETVVATSPVGAPGAALVMPTVTGAEARETLPRVSTAATVSVLGPPAGTATSALVPATWRYVAPLRLTR